jgi:hypothetical protein
MGSSNSAADPLPLLRLRGTSAALARRVAMARDDAAPALRLWLVDLVPLLVVLLIAAHVLALVPHPSFLVLSFLVFTRWRG